MEAAKNGGVDLGELPEDYRKLILEDEDSTRITTLVHEDGEVDHLTEKAVGPGIFEDWTKGRKWCGNTVFALNHKPEPSQSEELKTMLPEKKCCLCEAESESAITKCRVCQGWICAK